MHARSSENLIVPPSDSDNQCFKELPMPALQLIVSTRAKKVPSFASGLEKAL